MKHGNKAAPEKAAKAAPWSGSAVVAKGDAQLDERTAEELDELDDEFEDDRGLETIRCGSLPADPAPRSAAGLPPAHHCCRTIDRYMACYADAAGHRSPLKDASHRAALAFEP